MVKIDEDSIDFSQLLLGYHTKSYLCVSVSQVRVEGRGAKDCRFRVAKPHHPTSHIN